MADVRMWRYPLAIAACPLPSAALCFAATMSYYGPHEGPLDAYLAMAAGMALYVAAPAGILAALIVTALILKGEIGRRVVWIVPIFVTTCALAFFLMSAPASAENAATGALLGLPTAFAYCLAVGAQWRLKKQKVDEAT